MDFFVRYFVELQLPTTVVEQALDELPPDWLLAIARQAHARALGLLLESDADLGSDPTGTLVELSTESATRSGSTTIRPMAWTLIGPGSAMPFLQADLEVGSLGRDRTQLALSGRYFLPGAHRHAHLDRGTAQRVGEATIKSFVDGLANLVEKHALGVPGLRLPVAPSEDWRLKFV
jgi:hypothetical protein